MIYTQKPPTGRPRVFINKVGVRVVFYQREEVWGRVVSIVVRYHQAFPGQNDPFRLAVKGFGTDCFSI
jgi:hypothetical protein